MDQPSFEALSIRYLTGEVTPSERETLEQAIENTVAFQHQFETLKKIWQAPQIEMAGVDVDLAWHELSERLALDTPHVNHSKPHRKARAMWQIWAVAAGILILIGGLWAYRDMTLEILSFQSPRPDLAQIKEQTLPGERQIIRLPDDSEVHLNVETTLTYQSGFSDSIRLINLDGEAFFNVVADGRPFIVRTPTTSIRVMGTSFNVRTRENITTVVVKTGQVSVQDVGQPLQGGVVLHPNQRSIHRPGQVLTPPESVDAENILGWLRGELVFDGVAIEQVLAELTRVYGVPVIVKDENIRLRTITATFDEKSIKIALRSICLTANADFRLEKGTYFIFPRIE